LHLTHPAPKALVGGDATSVRVVAAVAIAALREKYPGEVADLRRRITACSRAVAELVQVVQALQRQERHYVLCA